MRTFYILTLSLLTSAAGAQISPYSKPAKQNYTPIPYQQLKAAQDSKNRQIVEQTQECARKLKAIVNNVYPNYPIIKDGWHEVYGTDDTYVCDQFSAYVLSQKIIRLKQGDGTIHSLNISTSINSATSTVVLDLPQHNNPMLTIYFIDDL